MTAHEHTPGQPQELQDWRGNTYDQGGPVEDEAITYCGVNDCEERSVRHQCNAEGDFGRTHWHGGIHRLANKSLEGFCHRHGVAVLQENARLREMRPDRSGLDITGESAKKWLAVGPNVWGTGWTKEIAVRIAIQQGIPTRAPTPWLFAIYEVDLEADEVYVDTFRVRGVKDDVQEWLTTTGDLEPVELHPGPA